jgi:hypothetical protein
MKSGKVKPGKIELHYLKKIKVRSYSGSPAVLSIFFRNKINEVSWRKGEEGLPSPATPPAFAERSSKSSLALILNRKEKNNS